MEDAPIATRRRFEADLKLALSLASKATTRKTQRSSSSSFGRWCDFCEEVGVTPSLSEIADDEARLSFLIVYGMRYRQSGATGHPVRADTVDKALLAMCQGITHLGKPDPVLCGPQGSTHTLWSDFLKALRDDDDPPSRAYPANITIIRRLSEVLDTNDSVHGALNEHTIDLIIVAFFWLLRPAEYLEPTTQGARSQPFQLQHIHLTTGDMVYHAPTAPLNDATFVSRITYATLTFADQKNAVRGEQVGHRATSDPFLCPAKALGRIASRLQQWGATPTTPIFRHFNSHPSHRRWYSVKNTHIRNALQHSAKDLFGNTGIDWKLLSTRSLRPGGATALLCAGVDKDAIQLLGRWKSDAMLRYLRIQAASHAHNYAQLMLDNGSYTFTPSI